MIQEELFGEVTSIRLAEKAGVTHEHIMKQLRLLLKHGKQGIRFHDDYAVLSSKTAKDMLDSLRGTRQVKQARQDMVDAPSSFARQFVEDFRRAGKVTSLACAEAMGVSHRHFREKCARAFRDAQEAGDASGFQFGTLEGKNIISMRKDVVLRLLRHLTGGDSTLVRRRMELIDLIEKVVPDVPSGLSNCHKDCRSDASPEKYSSAYVSEHVSEIEKKRLEIEKKRKALSNRVTAYRFVKLAREGESICDNGYLCSDKYYEHVKKSGGTFADCAGADVSFLNKFFRTALMEAISNVLPTGLWFIVGNDVCCLKSIGATMVCQVIEEYGLGKKTIDAPEILAIERTKGDFVSVDTIARAARLVFEKIDSSKSDFILDWNRMKKPVCHECSLALALILSENAGLKKLVLDGIIKI